LLFLPKKINVRLKEAGQPVQTLGSILDEWAAAVAYHGGMSFNAVVNTWYQSKITDRTFLGQLLRKLRRSYLGTFKPEVIQKSIKETRKGDCHRCGLCCELIYKCPFLGKDHQNLPYCRIYGDLRPANCKNYPFDETDSEIDQCGFTFKESTSKTSSR
jgi:hypothetical protein